MEAITVLKELEPCLELLNKAYEKNKDLGLIIRRLEFLAELGKRELEGGLKQENFTDQLTSLINQHSKENESNTPDFILSTYIHRCLDNFNAAVNERTQWYKPKKQNDGN